MCIRDRYCIVHPNHCGFRGGRVCPAVDMETDAHQRHMLSIFEDSVRAPKLVELYDDGGQLFLYTAFVVLRRGMHVVCLHLQHIRRI